ncbi:MAG: arsenic resistance protein [Microthrixaceae bacterium]|nr:arsenic resistance protein [Microthrixaceae bacterium]
MTRWQVPVVLGAVAIGLIIGLTTDVGDQAERLVVPALVALLALTFAGVHADAFTDAIRPHPRTAWVSLIINFMWVPLLAGALGWVFLSNDPDLRIGLVMLLVTPCTDWYLVFIATARDNGALGAALLPVNLILQLALLPIFVVALTGTAADVPIGDLLVSVAVVLGVPLAVAVGARFAATKAGASERLDSLLDRSGTVGLALLAVAVTAIFAAHAQLVADEPAALLRLLVPLLAFFVAAYLVANIVATRLDLAHPERVTLAMTTMARNSPVALAIATTAFPDQPLIAVALVFGPLLELPVLAGASQLLHDAQKFRPRRRVERREAVAALAPAAGRSRTSRNRWRDRIRLGSSGEVATSSRAAIADRAASRRGNFAWPEDHRVQQVRHHGEGMLRRPAS